MGVPLSLSLCQKELFHLYFEMLNFGDKKNVIRLWEDSLDNKFWYMCKSEHWVYIGKINHLYLYEHQICVVSSSYNKHYKDISRGKWSFWLNDWETHSFNVLVKSAFSSYPPFLRKQHRKLPRFCVKSKLGSVFCCDVTEAHHWQVSFMFFYTLINYI